MFKEKCFSGSLRQIISIITREIAKIYSQTIYKKRKYSKTGKHLKGGSRRAKNDSFMSKRIMETNDFFVYAKGKIAIAMNGTRIAGLKATKLRGWERRS